MNPKSRISDTEWESHEKFFGFNLPCPLRISLMRCQRATIGIPRPLRLPESPRRAKNEALGFRKEGRSYFYRPLVTEAGMCRGGKRESFLSRVFGGSLKPMFAHFAETRKLSPAEIAELKQLLKKSEEK